MQQGCPFDHAEQASGQGAFYREPDNNSDNQSKQPRQKFLRHLPRRFHTQWHIRLPRSMDTGDIVTEIDPDYQQMTHRPQLKVTQCDFRGRARKRNVIVLEGG